MPALPLPTGGATHLFEAIAMLLALQLMIGRKEVWLPGRWRNLRFEGDKRERFIATPHYDVRWFERRSRPRGRFLFGRRMSNVVFGTLVMGGTVAAFVAPPFSMLDTLPALGVSSFRSAYSSTTSSSSLSEWLSVRAASPLSLIVGRAAFRGIEDWAGLAAGPVVSCASPPGRDLALCDQCTCDARAVATRGVSPAGPGDGFAPGSGRLDDAAVGSGLNNPRGSLYPKTQSCIAGPGTPYVTPAPRRPICRCGYAGRRLRVGLVSTAPLQPRSAPWARQRWEPLIRLEGVGRPYRVGDNQVVALADVSFEVWPEEFGRGLGTARVSQDNAAEDDRRAPLAHRGPSGGGRARHDTHRHTGGPL